MTFQDRLRKILQLRGWTQAQLASCMGCTPGTLSSYLSERNAPRLHDLISYADRLGVTVAWLVGEDVTPVTYNDIIDIIDGLAANQAIQLNVSVNDNVLTLTTANTPLVAHYSLMDTFRDMHSLHKNYFTSTKLEQYLEQEKGLYDNEPKPEDYPNVTQKES